MYIHVIDSIAGRLDNAKSILPRAPIVLRVRSRVPAEVNSRKAISHVWKR